MKQVSILFLTMLITASFYSQSVNKGRIQLKAGVGFFYSKQKSSNSFPGTGALVSSGAQNRNFGENNIALLVNTHKDFALGITVVNQSYSSESKVSSQGIGISAEYYIINNPYFNLYINTTAGKLTGTWSDFKDAETLKKSAKGSFSTFGLGMNTYIGKVFGFYAVAGYKRQGVGITKASIGGVDQSHVGNIKIIDLNYLNRGGFINFGITIKLRNKSGEKKFK